MKKPQEKSQKAAERKVVKPSYVVFISHSSLDKWIAQVMAEKIEALGAQAWLDMKELEGGAVISEEIRRGIDECQETIVLVSSNSINSQWVIFEIGATWGQHKRVTPILLNVSGDAIAPMKDVRAMDINRFDEFLSQLKKRIQQAAKRVKR
jgi:hypothetical protein